MILGKKQLVDRLSRPFDDEKALAVTPLVTPLQSLDEDSLDLRLGTTFIMSRSDRLAVNTPGRAQTEEYHRTVHVPFGKYLILPGHHTVLASTLEFIKLPPDLAAMVLTKSSWARTFITVETAPWVHPSYRGCLTFEIANVSETPLALYPGLSMAQLVVMLVAGREDARDKLSGKYLGPVRPESPVLQTPEVALTNQLGLDRNHIHSPYTIKGQ